MIDQEPVTLKLNGTGYTSLNLVTEIFTYHSAQSSNSLIDPKESIPLQSDLTHTTNKTYNPTFSTDELISDISRSRPTSPGFNNSHILMLQRAPTLVRVFLLNAFNQLSDKGSFPSSWKSPPFFHFSNQENLYSNSTVTNLLH